MRDMKIDGAFPGRALSGGTVISAGKDGLVVSELTRRRFIKRMGGATMVAAVPWSFPGISRATVLPSFDIEGMLCSAPTVTEVAEVTRKFALPIIGSNPPLETDIDLVLYHRSTKLDDPSGTTPYGSCSFQHMAWLEAYDTSATLLATTPMILWDLSASYDYAADVVNVSGSLVGSSAARNSPTFVKGGQTCYLSVVPYPAGDTVGSGTPTASINTFVMGRFTVGTPGGGTTGYWGIPSSGSDELTSTFFAA